MFSFYVHLKNALHQHLQKASFALPQLLSSQFIRVILQYAWCTDDHVHVDNDGEDFVEDDVDDDGDDDVQRSPNSCDPARLKCQTPTNSLSYS